MDSGSFRRRLTAGIAATVAVLAVTACQTGDTGSDPSNPHQVEIVTWSASASDRTALRHLIEVFGRQHPEIEVIDASVRGEGGAEARDAIAARLDAGNAPDIVQVSAGAALAGYIADGALQDVSGFAAEERIADHVRAELLDLLRVDGRLYAIPVSIYRANLLWSNRQRLEAASIDASVPAADLGAWIADLERVRASGVRYPLALGNGFTQLQLFESVLLSRLGPEAYSALWLDADAWTGPAVGEAIADFARLLEFTNPADSARDESAIVSQVISGTAAYVVMADYAERQFQSSGYRFGEQYVASPVPGTDGVFAVAADAFAMPGGGAHEAAARAWLSTAGSVDGQRALSVTKGSLPARLDISSLDYPPFQKSQIAALSIDTLVPSLSQGVAAPPGRTAAISDALARFRADLRVGALMQQLEHAASNAL